MIGTTYEYVELLKDSLLNRLDWLNEVKFLGRQDPTGVIKGNDEFAGLNDTLGNMGYIRYRDDNDHSYSEPEKRLTSAPTQLVSAHLRLVVMHTCANADDMEWVVWNELQIAPHVAKEEYRLKVLNSTKDKQFIFMEETEEGTTTDDRWNLILFDFDLLYHRVATADDNCIPSCDVC